MGKNLRTWLVMAALAAGGCGDDGGGAQTEATSPHPYKPGETTVIDQDGQPKDFADTTGAGCLKGTDGKCVDLGKECAPTDKVDVILDKDGTVLFSQAFTLTPVVNVFGGMTSNGLQLLIEAN